MNPLDALGARGELTKPPGPLLNLQMLGVRILVDKLSLRDAAAESLIIRPEGFQERELPYAEGTIASFGSECKWKDRYQVGVTRLLINFSRTEKVKHDGNIYYTLNEDAVVGIIT